MSQYNLDWDTHLEPQLKGWNAGFCVVKLAELEHSGLSVKCNLLEQSRSGWRRNRNATVNWEHLLRLSIDILASLELFDGPCIACTFTLVSNGSGPSLCVQIWVPPKPLPNWWSGLSINPNSQPGYSSMVNSQPIWIGRVVSGLSSGSIHRFIEGSCFWSKWIVFYWNRVFNNEGYVFACFAACNINWFGIGIWPFIHCIFLYHGGH